MPSIAATDCFDQELFGQHCRELMHKWKHNITMVADVTGLGYTSCQSILGEKRAKARDAISLRTAVKLAIYFDLSLDAYIIGRT